MFYANNEQVKGIFLNGRNYNYLVYGFGKIIPEDRNAEQLNLNLAYKYLNQYRIEWGTVKDGYENALVSPRFDKPDGNGVFHTPFTYYYDGNIISTKQVPVLITNGTYALSNALVYNDMNINGAINDLAENTDFQGHNINVYPERNYQASPLLYDEVLNNCSNFDLNINTRFSKSSYPTLYNCNNFSGNFRYVGNSDVKYPGFIGFLYECKDGVFNIDCTNMHGGGSAANVRNYYNFSGIQFCENMNVNITGSSWQVWPHDHSFTSNCNINTYNVISGFGYMNYCNFDITLPKDSKPEMTSGFEFLNNAENCSYNLNALDVNLYNYRSGVGQVAFFNELNNCNLNLLVNNTVSFESPFGGNFNNCSIVFDNIKAGLVTSNGWWNLHNCNISGNVESASSKQGFLEYCDGLNINLNAAKSSRILPIWGSRNVNGNLVCGDITYVTYSSYLNLNINNGSLELINVEHGRFNSNGTSVHCTNLNNCMFEIHNSNDFVVNTASNCNFNLYNSVGTAILNKLNNVKFVERVGANYTITIDNCYNSWIYANTMSGTIENVYNTRIELEDNDPYFGMWRVNNCEITGFPTSEAYTTNCTFNASIPHAVFRNSSYITWDNVWPHATPRGSDGWNTLYRTKAGLRSVDNFSECYLNCNDGSLVSYEYRVNFDNSNNMQLDIKKFYNGVVTANLPIYNMRIKLNVDCNTLNLGIFQAGPPHGFENSSISANDIYAKGNMTNAYVQLSNGARLYCENYCSVCFSPYIYNYNSVAQPVMLINNYDHTNTDNQYFIGGLTRIGRQSARTGPRHFSLYSGACLFINNVVLNGADVNSSLLFVGSNVTWANGINITNGGRVRNAANLTNDDINFINRGQLCWNIWDSGPWGPQSLLDFCTNV